MRRQRGPRLPAAASILSLSQAEGDHRREGQLGAANPRLVWPELFLCREKVAVMAKDFEVALVVQAVSWPVTASEWFDMVNLEPVP